MVEKFAALTFQSIDDFEICNKFMEAKPNNIGLCTNKNADFTKGESLENSCLSQGKLCVIVKTDNLLIPPGTLIVKTKQGRDISIKVTSGIGTKIADVESGIITPV